MTETETNVPADDAGADDPVTADEIARAELAKEARLKEAAQPVENLQRIGADAQVDADIQSRDDFRAVLSQSVVGNNLTDREIAIADENFTPFIAAHPEWAQQWKAALNTADLVGWATERASRGEIPNGPPSKYADEIAAASQRASAKRELQAIMRGHPPGSQGYIERMPRIQALWQLESAGEAIVGHSLRRV